MRVRHTLSAFALAAAAGPAPISARAAVVHDNGPFATGGWRLDARLVADDFTFQSTTSFNTIRFWALVDGGTHVLHHGVSELAGRADPVGDLACDFGEALWAHDHEGDQQDEPEFRDADAEEFHISK